MLGRRRRVGAHAAADTDSWALPSLMAERVAYRLLLRRPRALCLRIFGVQFLWLPPTGVTEWFPGTQDLQWGNLQSLGDTRISWLP